MSNSLRPHGLQHTRPPCPSPTPGVYSDLPIESVMPSNHLILCRPFLLLPSVFPSIRVFSNESSLQCRCSVQFSSVAQSCPTLCDPMNRSTPGLPVHHQLPEFTQAHVHRVGCHLAISSSVVPFSSCPQSLPASESFPMSQLFA